MCAYAARASKQCKRSKRAFAALTEPRHNTQVCNHERACIMPRNPRAVAQLQVMHNADFAQAKCICPCGLFYAGLLAFCPPLQPTHTFQGKAFLYVATAYNISCRPVSNQVDCMSKRSQLQSHGMQCCLVATSHVSNYCACV